MSISSLSILTVAGVPAAMLLALLAAPSSAHAAEFEVDDLADAHDLNPGDGNCQASRPYGCTLRAAIEEANADSGHDVIRVAGPSTYTLELGHLLVSESVGIYGEPGVVVDGDGSSRVFYVLNGGVTITDLTITGGFDPDYSGAGILIGADAQLHLVRCVVEQNSASQPGSGIANDGHLHVDRSSVRDNENYQFWDAGGGVTSTGGGIHNGYGAILIVEQSAIVNNRAFRGGGISNSGGWVSITDSTISGNIAKGSGAGILNTQGDGVLGEVYIERSTITDNELPYEDTNELVGGAGIANVMSYVSIHASIVAANHQPDLGIHVYAPDCADFEDYVGEPGFGWLTGPGEYWSASYNLMGSLEGCDDFDPASEDIVPTGDDPVDPLLGPLAPWTPGGTELHIPSLESPAILAGPRCQLPPFPGTPIPDCFDVDQRGYLRSSGEPPTDIGAYESNGTPPPPPRGG
jgi:CSLREA domain-containing protein